MAWSQASRSIASRAARREQLRRRARRERRLAALAVFGCVVVLVVALTTFGSDRRTVVPAGGPAPAERLLPAGPPQPHVVALHENLRILLPVSRSRITAIGFHPAGEGALPLEPVGVQANAGLLERVVRKLFGGNDVGLRYYVIEGGVGPRTGGLDVGAPADADVYAPVDGTVIAISDRIVNGRSHGVTIDIQPSGSPGLVVTVANVVPDPALTVGSSVSAARTKIGRILDLSTVEEPALARYTQDRGQHVHIEVHPAASLLTP
jgi:murein DD-endopeptidase MepM/ murein hydrolase activator NlpD